MKKAFFLNNPEPKLKAWQVFSSDAQRWVFIYIDRRWCVQNQALTPTQTAELLLGQILEITSMIIRHRASPNSISRFLPDSSEHPIFRIEYNEVGFSILQGPVRAGGLRVEMDIRYHNGSSRDGVPWELNIACFTYEIMSYPRSSTSSPCNQRSTAIVVCDVNVSERPRHGQST